MAGYTSRFLLTFSIPFFGFVLWFLKKKKSPKSVLSKSIQVQDCISPALCETETFVFESTSIENQESSCEDKSNMQLKETQTPESESTTVSQQNGVSQDVVQQNGVSQACAQQHNDAYNVTEKDAMQLTVQQNGVSNNATSCDISQDSAHNIIENNVQENGASSNHLQQNAISQKNVLQNGTQQNGVSKGKKKKKSKVHEKTDTCPTDIISSNGRLHLEEERDLIKRVEVLNFVVSAKNELLNTINTNEMDKVNGTNCDSHSSACVNGDANHETNLTTVKDGESAKECDKETQASNARNSSKTKLLQTEICTDLCTSLILPDDCANVMQTNGDMMESSGTSYCDSLGSTDSGRGGSEIHYPPGQENSTLSYAFEIPQKYVGLLIGRQGKNVNLIKEKTNADILIKRHPTTNQNKICLISGSEDEINSALQKIREKFPPERYPNVTLSQICFLPFMPCPENLMLRLPEGSSFDVMLSATVTAGHFFLQQPTHPTYHSLVGLTYQMSEMYNCDLTAPPLPTMEKGFICAANLYNCWYRAVIDEVFYETDECRVKFLDYGGYMLVPRSALRQINYQFMNMPFQATECYLGHVTLPEDETEWSPQATASFEELAQGQILQGFIIAYAENGVPYVQLYRITGIEHIDINMALVQKGHARCIKPQPAV